MTLRGMILATLLSLATASAAADPPRPPIASNPIADLKGTVAKTQLAPGEGMPYLEVATPQGAVKLFLGSMRYLMQEDFNPKAGEPVEARGYKMADGSIVGIRVDLPASKKTLKLRDENGWPLWMGGRRPGSGPGSGMGTGMRRGGPPKQ